MSHGHRRKSRTRPSARKEAVAPPWSTSNEEPSSDSDGELGRAQARRLSNEAKRRLDEGDPLPWEKQRQRTILVQPTTPVSDVKKEEVSSWPSEKSLTAAERPVRIKNPDDPAE